MKIYIATPLGIDWFKEESLAEVKTAHSTTTRVLLESQNYTNEAHNYI